jgi:hypothetical protein
MNDESERGSGSDAGDVGAGTGASARDVGEEGTPAAIESERGVARTTDEENEWSAIAGGPMSEQGAAGGVLRDERARQPEDDASS